MNRVLVISPHPDDEAIGCGGTLLRHVSVGDAVKAVFLTSGERGGHGLTEERTRGIREREARTATAEMGLESVEFWRERDGALKAGRSLCARMSHLLRAWRPHTVYVTHELEMHPDHRAAARLMRVAVRDLGPRSRPDRVLMYEVWTPMPRMDEIVDISAFIDRKIAAIRTYRSQCRYVAFDDAAKGLNRYRGEMHCWPEGRFAEVFTELIP